MKNIHSTTIRLDDEAYKLVKQSTEALGISMNELISLLIHSHLPLDTGDLVRYRYMKLFAKVGEDHDE